MPRFTVSEQWLAGYVSGRIDELRRVLDKLQSATAFTLDEMAHMRSDVLRLDEAVRPQWREARVQVIRPIRRNYEELLELTLNELARRERHEGLPSGESAAMYEYRRRLENPSVDGYDSDGKYDQPLETWTVPLTGTDDRANNTGDLRRILEQRETTGCVRNWDNYRPTVPSVVVRPAMPRVALAMETPLYGGEWAADAPLYGGSRAGPSRPRSPNVTPSTSATTLHRKPHRPSPTHSIASTSSSRSVATNVPTRPRRPSVSSGHSQFSYRSRNTHASGGNAPPFGRKLPVPIDRHDPSIIGRAEMFCHPPEDGSPCIICRSLSHRACHCPEFRAMTLCERWYRILSAGACLHCLRRGHTSGFCGDKRPCKCGILHNSLMCNRFVSRRR